MEIGGVRQLTIGPVRFDAVVFRWVRFNKAVMVLLGAEGCGINRQIADRFGEAVKVCTGTARWYLIRQLRRGAVS